MIGFIGLGRMGYGMVARLAKIRQDVVVYNRTPDKTRKAQELGVQGAFSIPDFFAMLGKDRIVWLMVPHDAVDEVIAKIMPFLKPHDILVDGGNSHFTLSQARAKKLARKKIRYVDVGVSGGTVAASIGYCMMVGADKQSYAALEPYLKVMCVENGCLHAGSSGAGHYVKMVHNAIEYGMMQSIGEGFELLRRGPVKDLDMLAISRLYNNGSIIRSFLMEMTTNAFEHHPDLSDVPGKVADTGEGRWAVELAKKKKIEFKTIDESLKARVRSRKKPTYSSKLVAALRDEFGGHGLGK